MDSQQHPLDFSPFSHALPASPSSAEQDKVVASFSTLPPELKLKIAEEAYEMPYEETEQAQGNSRVRSQKCGGAEALSRVNKDFHDLCKPLRWKHVDLASIPSQLLDRFLKTAFRKHNTLIQEYTIDCTGRPTLDALADTAEALEIKMTGSSSRRAARSYSAPGSEPISYHFPLEEGYDSEGILLSFLIRTTPNLNKVTARGIHGVFRLIDSLGVRRTATLRSISLKLVQESASAIPALLKHEKLLEDVRLEYFSPISDLYPVVVPAYLRALALELSTTLFALPYLVSLSARGIPFPIPFVPRGALPPPSNSSNSSPSPSSKLPSFFPV